MAPVRFDKKKGKPLGTVGANKQGGVYALLTPESHLIHGRGVFRGGVSESAPAQKDVLITYEGGRSIVVTASRSFLLKARELVCVDREKLFGLRVQRRELSARHGALKKRYDAARKRTGDGRDPERIAALREQLLGAGEELDDNSRQQEACVRWTVESGHPHAMILAGGHLVCGGDGEIVVRDAEDGSVRWRAPVDGRAEGLAAARGRVYVSTDRGAIHCFVSP